MDEKVDWKDIGAINAIVLAWGAICLGILSKMGKSAIADALSKYDKDHIEPMRESIHRVELTSVKLDTWLEMSKSRSASRGIADQNSPYRINMDRLGEMIESSGYVATPEMVEEFVRIVDDPNTPEDDSALWHQIEAKFGVQALAEECKRFGAEPDEAPGIWIMCIREAQEIGAEELLRRIKVIR